MAELDKQEHRKIQRKVAREYRKLGFKVLEDPSGENLPTFLSGFTPDLIATDDDERIVVEIKRADQLKGSNELTELAARVAEHPPWRFELITLEAPDGGESPATWEANIGPLFQTALKHYAMGDDALRKTLLISMVSILEALLNQIALERGIGVNNRTMGSLIRELSFQGILDDAMTTALERAWTSRNTAVHGGPVEQAPDLGEIESLASDFHDLRNKLFDFWDAGATARTKFAYSDAAISGLPDTNPAVYAVQAAGGRVNYIGVAAAGHMRKRIRQHMSDRSLRVPGEKLTVLLFDDEEKARRAETNAIQEFSPKYNRLSRDADLTSRSG